jgi:hypothetical protein
MARKPRINEADPNQVPHALTADDLAGTQIKCLYRGRIYYGNQDICVQGKTWVCEATGWRNTGNDCAP